MEACVWLIPLTLFEVCIAANREQAYPNVTVAASQKGKAMASCNILFDSQMLIIGGVPGKLEGLNCDNPDAKGQHGYLLNQGDYTAWKTLMPSVTSYLVPEAITSIVGGGHVWAFQLFKNLLTGEQAIGICHGDSTR